MKKLVSAALVLMLILSLAATALAEGEATYTLTLTNALAGHTYSVYQVFGGKLTADDAGNPVLVDIVWGSGVSAAGQTALGDAAEKAETLKQVSNAEAFAAAVAPYLTSAAGSATVAENASSCEITGLSAGYYLVKTTGVTEVNGAYTYYVLKVVDNTEARMKADVPEVKKSVDDPDVNIGDTITYTLTATMPSSIAGYESYRLVFHDTMSEGLDYIAVTSVTAAGKTMAETTNYVPAWNEASRELTVTIDDVLIPFEYDSEIAGNDVVVTYTAKLNEKAIIGAEGNDNTVYLEYSNNPNHTGEGVPTGNTPPDEETVYTWKLPVFKYTGPEENKTPLAGAGFTLYTDETCIASVYLVDAGNGIYKVCNIPGCTEHTPHVTEIITGENGKFEIQGLEKGTYYLKETTVPAGYNSCDVVTVVIGDGGALAQNGAAVTEVQIQNNSGTTLPSTGGIGTTVFYILGGILVVAAVVLLVTKKRMNSAD